MRSGGRSEPHADSSDRWRKVRNANTPCELCKRMFMPGEWYWGRSYSRWCWECAETTPELGATTPPDDALCTALWDRDRSEYVMLTWNPPTP